MTVFCVYDSKAELFGDPFFAVNRQTGQRIFSHVVNNPETDLAKFPTDFVLYELGEFDKRTGRFEEYEKHVHLGIAAQYQTVETQTDFTETD